MTDVRAVFERLPGVLGDKTSARAFAELWSRRTGQAFRVGLEQRIYQAAQTHSPDGVSGRLRLAEPEDRALLQSWFVRFNEDTGGGPQTAPDLWVDLHLVQDESTGIGVWDVDGSAVSMAAYSGPSPNGIRVGGVYTPPELRRRGYATACVAALTQRLLDGGRRFCFLYTDLANPTSNSIYRNIGYRPVCDVQQYRFD